MPVDLPFFDSSYLVRLYLEDTGFEEVRALARTGEGLAAAARVIARQGNREEWMAGTSLESQRQAVP